MSNIEVQSQPHESVVPVNHLEVDPRALQRQHDLPPEEPGTPGLSPVANLDVRRNAKAQEQSDKATRHAQAGFVDASEYRGVGDNAKEIKLPEPPKRVKASKWLLGKIGGPDIIERSEEVLERKQNGEVRTAVDVPSRNKFDSMNEAGVLAYGTQRREKLGTKLGSVKNFRG